MLIGKILDFLVRRRRPLKGLMLAIMAALVVMDLLVPPDYVRFPWDAMGGFGALYGFVACVLIIGLAKLLGYGLLYRDESYYRGGERHDHD